MQYFVTYNDANKVSHRLGPFPTPEAAWDRADELVGGPQYLIDVEDEDGESVDR